MTALTIVCLIVGGYLIGNISTARIIAKLVAHKNITQIGSGNPGSMNMLRNLGFWCGAVTLVGDMLKALLPSLVGYFLLGETGLYITGISVMIGHIFPIFYRFKGGKGVACALGMFTVACWWLAIPLFAVSLTFIYFTGLGSICSLTYTLVMSVLMSILCIPSALVYVLIWASCASIYFAHRSNIVRIFNGTETKTTFKLTKNIKKGDNT